MTLHAPFFITSRLLPGLRIGSGTVQLEFAHARMGRAFYKWTIDIPAGEFSGNDLSGHGGLQSMFASLLSFLGAAAESYRHYDCDYERACLQGSNANLFPQEVVEWAYENSDEIGMMELEISEHDTNLIED